MIPTILLVEDEPLLNIAMSEIMEESGYNVIECFSGQEALSLLKDSNITFDCLVTDIRLGNGPTGWDVGRRVRELSEKAAIIYMSGDSYADWDRQGMPDSVMLVKPMHFERLIDALAGALIKRNSETT